MQSFLEDGWWWLEYTEVAFFFLGENEKQQLMEELSGENKKLLQNVRQLEIHKIADFAQRPMMWEVSRRTCRLQWFHRPGTSQTLERLNVTLVEKKQLTSPASFHVPSIQK